MVLLLKWKLFHFGYGVCNSYTIYLRYGFYSCEYTHRDLLYLNPEDRGSIVLWNTGTQLPESVEHRRPQHEYGRTAEFLESSNWQSTTPDNSVLEESSYKPGSSTVHNFQSVYWFHDFILGYPNSISPLSNYNGFERSKDESARYCWE